MLKNLELQGLVVESIRTDFLIDNISKKIIKIFENIFII